MRKRNKEKEAARQRVYNKLPKRIKYMLAWKKKNRARINELARKRYTTDGRWEKQLRDRFNLEPEQYWKMYEEQNGLCAICGKQQFVGIKLDVDHDHKTGKVRALLCRHCNAGIGLLKDSVFLVEKALEYLRSFSGLDKEPLDVLVSKDEKTALNFAHDRSIIIGASPSRQKG